MFRRIITIDGDRFMVQMMTLNQLKFAIHYPVNCRTSHLMVEPNHKGFVKQDSQDGSQWIMTSNGKQLFHYAVTGKQAHTRGVEDLLNQPFNLWISMVPVNVEGHPYRLNPNDFPDGTLTYGGSLYMPNKHWQAPHICNQNEPFPIIGDTEKEDLPWVTHNGFLLSRLPIYICTPTMLEAEVARIVKLRKAEVEKDVSEGH